MTPLIPIAQASALLLIVLIACTRSGRFVGIGALLMVGVAFVVGIR